MTTRTSFRKSSNKITHLQLCKKPSIRSHQPLAGKIHGPIPTHNGDSRRSFKSLSSASRDSASVVGCVVGSNGFSVQPEMSQITCSQASIADHQETMSTRSSRSRLSPALTYPPMHQNSSISSCSSGQQQSASFGVGNGSQSHKISHHLPQSRILPYCRDQPHHTHGRSSSLSPSSGAPSSTRSTNNRSVGEKSILRQRMIPRHIGTSHGSTSSKPRSRCPPIIFRAPLPGQATASTSNGSTVTETARPSTSSRKPTSPADVNRIEAMHAELKTYFEKHMKSIKEKSDELEKKQIQLEESVRQCQKIEGKIDSFDAKHDSRQRRFHEDCDKAISTLDQNGKSWLASINECGKSQQKAVISALDASKDSLAKQYNQYVQALPTLIQPTLKKVISSIYPMMQDKMPWCLSTMALPSSPITNDASKKVSSEEESDDSYEVHQEVSMDTTESNPCRRYPTRMWKHSATPPKPKSYANEDAPCTVKRCPQRRSKRAKDGNEKESKTPVSKVSRPCVTPSVEPSSKRRRKNAVKTKPVSRNATKTTMKATAKSKKRACNTQLADSSGVTRKKHRVPFEVVTDNAQCPSPLSEDSVHRYAGSKGIKISVPRGSSSRLVKRSKRYGRKRQVSADLLENEFSADSFKFCN